MSINRALEQLGVFFRPGFLAPSECRSLIAAIESTSRQPGGVYDEAAQTRVDTAIRQVSETAEAVEGLRPLRDRLMALIPDIVEHFHTPVEKIEGPTLLVYRPGDFFLPHRDDGESGLVHGRKVTAVIYLNSPSSPEGGGYQGADLSLFGLMSFPGSENHGLPVDAETGLLVAFPSSLRHGVDPLLHGSRYCAVTWYR